MANSPEIFFLSQLCAISVPLPIPHCSQRSYPHITHQTHSPASLARVPLFLKQENVSLQDTTIKLNENDALVHLYIFITLIISPLMRGLAVQTQPNVHLIVLAAFCVTASICKISICMPFHENILKHNLSIIHKVHSFLCSFT